MFMSILVIKAHIKYIILSIFVIYLPVTRVTNQAFQRPVKMLPVMTNYDMAIL